MVELDRVVERLIPSVLPNWRRDFSLGYHAYAVKVKNTINRDLPTVSEIFSTKRLQYFDPADFNFERSRDRGSIAYCKGLAVAKRALRLLSEEL